MNTRSKRAALACLTAAGVLAAARGAQADVCSSLGTHRVYITGSTAAASFVATLGQFLATQANPIYVIYNQQQGSCDGVHQMLDEPVLGTPPTPMGTGLANYYVPADFLDGGAAPTCTLENDVADIGLSDVFQDSCADFSTVHAIPMGIKDFQGPIQPMEFVVPAASSATSISADAAYFVFGFGGAGQVAPWTDDTFIYHRTALSGVQSMLAKAIGVPSDKWRPVGTNPGVAGATNSFATSGGVRDALKALNADATNAPKGIGTLSAGTADANPKTGPTTGLSRLAFQYTGQTCGYWADSTATSFDKVNVRDGHYAIWGPIHHLVKVNDMGQPTNSDVATIVNFVTEATDSDPFMNAVIDAHDVPQCAMKVQRSSEIGPYTPYHPAKPCGCYMEKRLGAGAECVSCNSDTDCGDAGDKVCSHSYCEAK